MVQRLNAAKETNVTWNINKHSYETKDFALLEDSEKEKVFISFFFVFSIDVIFHTMNLKVNIVFFQENKKK